MQTPSSFATPFDDLEPNAVLTAEAIASRLGVTSRSVRRAISRGELRASRACGLRVLAVDAVGWWRDRAVVGAVPERRRAAEPPPPIAARVPRAVRTSRDRLPLPPRGGGA